MGIHVRKKHGCNKEKPSRWSGLPTGSVSLRIDATCQLLPDRRLRAFHVQTWFGRGAYTLTVVDTGQWSGA